MKRLSILGIIQDKLQSITVANGYNTDIGNRVFYWQDLDFEYGETGAISFKDAFEETISNNTIYDKQLSIDVEAIKFTENALEDSCLILEDLINSLLKFKEIYAKLEIKVNEKKIETKGKKAIRIKLTNLIMYREN